MLRAIVAIAISIFSVQPARAQFMDSWTPPPFATTVESRTISQTLDGIKNNPKGTPSVPLNSANAAAILTYRRDPALTRQNLSKFARQLGGSNPQAVAQFEQSFKSTDIIGAVGGVMKSLGIEPNNVAHAFTLYWVTAWHAAHGVTRDPDAATLKAVAAQVTDGFVNSGQFARATDAQKQEMAEGLMIQAVLIDSARESAAGNPAQLRALADALRKGAKGVGLDLDAMLLSEQGFRPANVQQAKAGATNAQPKQKTTQSGQPAPKGGFVAAFVHSEMQTSGGGTYVQYPTGGGAMTPSWSSGASDNIQILFADGTACWNCLDSWYADPSLSSYRRENPDEIGRWQRKGSSYVITYPRTPTNIFTYPATDALKRATPGARYHLKLSTNTGFSTGRLILRRDGSFTISADGSLAGNNGDASEHGRYAVTGPMIIFSFANGKKESYSILLDPKDNEVLFIDRSIYYVSNND